MNESIKRDLTARSEFEKKQPVTHKAVQIESDGTTLHGRLWQASSPQALLILVHGVISHSLWLSEIAQTLSMEGIQVLAVDRRGAGLNSTNPGDAKSGKQLLSDLDCWLEYAQRFNLPLHLGGFCWGANYAINYLQSMHRKIESVVLLAPSLFPSALILNQPFETGTSSAQTEPPTVPIEKFTSGPMFDSFIKPDPLKLSAVSKRMNGIMQEFSQGLWMKLLRINLPVMIVLGTKDEVVDNVATKRLFDRISNARSKMHAVDAAHGIQFDAPAETAALIVDWITGFQPTEQQGTARP